MNNQRILAFAGTKQAGKTSAANFLSGYILCGAKVNNISLPLPNEFTISEEGKLIIEADFKQADGTIEKHPAELDLRNRDTKFIEFAIQYIWPYVKIYSFADTLKEICMRVFNLGENQVYGNNHEKNSPTRILWKDMCAFLPPRTVKNIKDSGKYDSRMTAREILQYFGTNICRQLYDDCWVNDCVNKIICEGFPFAIIDDCRFNNEVYGIKKAGGKVIKLNRRPFKDKHASETGLRGMPNSDFNKVIKNDDMEINEKNQAILDTLREWSWIC